MIAFKAQFAMFWFFMYRHVLQATHVRAWSHPSKHCQEFQQIRQFSTDFKELWSQIYTQTHEFIDMATLNFDHEDDQDQLLSQALYVKTNLFDIFFNFTSAYFWSEFLGM